MQSDDYVIYEVSHKLVSQQALVSQASTQYRSQKPFEHKTLLSRHQLHYLELSRPDQLFLDYNSQYCITFCFDGAAMCSVLSCVSPCYWLLSALGLQSFSVNRIFSSGPTIQTFRHVEKSRRRGYIQSLMMHTYMYCQFFYVFRQFYSKECQVKNINTYGKFNLNSDFDI